MAEAGGTQVAPAPRVLRITSGCATRESFVAYFRAFCQDESIFIATKNPKPTGDRVRVSIALSTGTPLIVGAGVIGESYATGENPFRRPGMRIHFDDLSPESRAVFGEMGAARDENATIKAPNLAAMMAEAGPPPAAAPATPPMVPRPRSDTDLSDAPPVDGSAAMVAEAEQESRAPGSSFILPANPLSELDPVQLFAFVECTMVEEEEDQPAGALEEDGTAAPRHARDTEPAVLDDGVATERGFAPAPVGSPPPVAAMPLLAPVADASPPPDRKRLLVIGAVAGALPALLAGVLIGRSMRPETAAPMAADVTQEPAPTPVPAEPLGEPSRSEGAVDPGPSTGATGEECQLRVTSEPDGASVRLGDRTLGETPLSTALPCGSHEIELRRARYGEVTRKVELVPGQEQSVEVKLERPEYTLRVEATPRAMVTIDGKSAGMSPVSLKAPGHTPIDVSVSHVGYEPWSKQVRLSRNTRVDAKLTPIKLAPVAKPKPRTTGARPR